MSGTDYLKYFQNLRNLSSTNQTIRTMIEQHQLYFSQTDGSVGQIIAAVLEEKYSELLRAIRASTKNNGRQTSNFYQINLIKFKQLSNDSQIFELHNKPIKSKTGVRK